MFAYYHMKNCILLQNYDLAIFEGVIALFHLENLIQKRTHNSYRFLLPLVSSNSSYCILNVNPQNFAYLLITCLLLYKDLHIVTAV